MGGVISAIGKGLNVLISAIAGLLEAIVTATVTILVALIDLLEYILCCRCFGSRASESRIQRRRDRVEAASATNKT